MTWTLAELLEQVKVPLESPVANPQERSIAVNSVETDGAALLVAVDVFAPPRRESQSWLLRFRSMWSDVSGLPLQAAALTVRANIEEWWDTGAEVDGPGHLVTAHRTS